MFDTLCWLVSTALSIQQLVMLKTLHQLELPLS